MRVALHLTCTNSGYVESTVAIAVEPDAAEPDAAEPDALHLAGEGVRLVILGVPTSPVGRTQLTSLVRRLK